MVTEITMSSLLYCGQCKAKKDVDAFNLKSDGTRLKSCRQCLDRCRSARGRKEDAGLEVNLQQPQVIPSGEGLHWQPGTMPEVANQMDDDKEVETLRCQGCHPEKELGNLDHNHRDQLLLLYLDCWRGVSIPPVRTDVGVQEVSNYANPRPEIEYSRICGSAGTANCGKNWTSVVAGSEVTGKGVAGTAW
ncbi:hypothetical protein HOY80DRAFT_1053273 [Tuber brumale]|nr:hypothetical protein HOY80DRAFT_1053273 [Tuber brumale]